MHGWEHGKAGRKEGRRDSKMTVGDKQRERGGGEERER